MSGAQQSAALPLPKLTDVLSAGWRRRGAVAVVGIIGAIAAALPSLWLAPRYEAQATLVVTYDVLPDGRAPKARPVYFYEQLTRSRGVAAAALESLGVEQRGERTPAQLMSEIEGLMEARANLLRVRVGDSDPEMSAVLANAVGEAIVAAVAKLNGASAGAQLEHVQARATEAEALLAGARQALADFEASQGLRRQSGDLDARHKLQEELVLRRERIRIELQGLEASTRRSQASLEQLKPHVEMTKRLGESPLLSAAAERKGAGPRTRMRLAVAEQVPNDVRTRVETLHHQGAVNQARREAELAALEQEQTENLEKIAALEKRVAGLRQQRAKLSLEVQEAEKSARYFNEKLDDARLFAGVRQREIELLEAAVAPARPAGPSVLLRAGAGLCLGLLFGLGVALWLGRRELF